MTKKAGIVLGESHLREAERGVTRGPGHGFSSLGIEDALHARDSNREGLGPMPANSSERIDATRPAPHTKHTLSNTTKGPERFHAGHGDTPGGLNATASRAAPTMERNLEERAPTRHSPVPLGAQHPDLADRGKADEIAHADPNMGLGEHFDRGTMDR